LPNTNQVTRRESDRVDVYPGDDPEVVVLYSGAPEASRPRGWPRLIKRSIDLSLSTLMLVIAAPIFGAVAIAIKLDDGGPVFYSQDRWGYRGSRFRVFKFRSMSQDCDIGGIARPATEDDPRVTRTGRLLRRMGLDELPQLINIWKGHMSFVGPRALAIGEIVNGSDGVGMTYEGLPGFGERLSVRPGLTGMATIYLAKDSSPIDKFDQDIAYVRDQTIWLDLRLILLSFWISFRGKWESRESKI
jgi:lipopolysaccharide/colanic/teichoic acid biosynthesis glycosyltransferase